MRRSVAPDWPVVPVSSYDIIMISAFGFWFVYIVSHRSLCLLFDEVRQFSACVHGSAFGIRIRFARLLGLVPIRFADIFTRGRAHVFRKG